MLGVCLPSLYAALCLGQQLWSDQGWAIPCSKSRWAGSCPASNWDLNRSAFWFFFFLLVAVFYGWEEQRNQTNVHILRSWTFWTSITFSTWTAVISVGKLIWPQKRCRIIRTAPSNGSIGNFNSSLAQIGRRCPRVDFRSTGTRGAASGTVQFLALYPTYSHYCCNNIKHSCFVFSFFF